MDVPDVSYARSGDVAIAYQTVGDGPEDVVFVRGFAGDLLSVWEQPLLVRFIEKLASFARVTMIDKRGTGLSDRVRDVPTLETRMDDLRAVMDAIGAEQAVLSTAQEGARLAVLLGIHTGECERVGDKIAGLAVNVGARVSAAAAPGEVLVSGTVKDLVAGSGIEFEDRGVHELKGVPGEWRLYSVVNG